MFEREWFEMVDHAPPNAVRVRGWDLAASEEAQGKQRAWTVGAKLSRDPRTGIFYIEHVIRARKSPGKVEDMIRETAEMDGHNIKISIPQDPGQSGKSQARSLASLLVGYNVRFTPESGSKEARAIPLAAQAEAGNVKVVRGVWNGAFFDEITVFPASQFKDITDACSRAFSELVPGKKIPSIPAAPQAVELANG
jgi:predicted phage terminase large subunit-like protein